MPDSPPNDDSLLLIRCPSCGQRFKVGEDLRGRAVECGACEHRFKIFDEVIVRGRKFYPGERHDAKLSRFARVPVAVSEQSAHLGVRYQSAPDPVVVEPASPQRVVAGVVGGVGMGLMSLLLILGANRGGVLDGMITTNRVVMAAFTGLLGVVLIAYANPKARRKAMAWALLGFCILVSLPFIFTKGSAPLVTKPGVDFSAFDVKSVESPVGDAKLARLREEIGTQPLDEEIKELAGMSSSQRAVGIWVKGMREQNRLLVRDYLQRVTGVAQAPHFYPRGGGNFLLVISGTTATLDELAKVCDPHFGTVANIHEKLSVIEVEVDNSVFLSAPMDKLSNAADQGFYELNLRELGSIDLDRVSAAVKRLAQAEPKILRADVTARLLELLSAKWVTFKPDVCRALMVWSDKPGAAATRALAEVKALHEKSADIPKDMIALIVKEKNNGVIPILYDLWKQAPTNWELLLADVGPAAEDSLLAGFPATEGGLRQSAVRLLGRVGSEKSVSILQNAAATGDAEMKVLVEKALSSIRSRGGN